MDLMQRWMWLLPLAGGAWAAVELVAGGDVVLAIVVAVAALAFSWFLLPWRGGPTTRHEEVLAMPESERAVVIYWRPGCGYCARLRAALGDFADTAQWVNIWDDEDAAEFVRGVNDGDETVPTVVIDGEAHTNPDPQQVRERLAAGD